MGRKSARTPQERLEARLETFREWLCTEWGFCGTAGISPVDYARESWSADEFAREVLRAEGIGDLETEYRRKIREEFQRRYGDRLSVADFG